MIQIFSVKYFDTLLSPPTDEVMSNMLTQCVVSIFSNTVMGCCHNRTEFPMVFNSPKWLKHTLCKDDRSSVGALFALLWVLRICCQTKKMTRTYTWLLYVLQVTENIQWPASFVIVSFVMENKTGKWNGVLLLEYILKFYNY